MKMVDAGWHYCPTVESDDYARCAYCSLSLDGWEPKDDPQYVSELTSCVHLLMDYSDEHQRRSPDCVFFAFAVSKPKVGRAKKGRASTTSRLSTQSGLTAVTEGASIAETEINQEESMISTIDAAKPTKRAKGGKKTVKAKKVPSRAKGKVIKAKQEESQLASSFVEPEDDDFEVKVAQPPAQTLKTRKRKSEHISTGEEAMAEPRINPKVEEPPSPPRKRRATRASSSVAAAQETPMSNHEAGIELDAHMTGGEEMPPPFVPPAKKSRKGSKKRVSSTARRVSSASTASKASLRAAIPNDEEIDAALEAELDRALTDEEGDPDTLEVEQPKSRRLTRSKPGPTKAMASVAPMRKGTRASTLRNEGTSMAEMYPSIPSASDNEREAVAPEPTEDIPLDVAADHSSKTKNVLMKGSRKASARQPNRKYKTDNPEEGTATIHETKEPQRDDAKKSSLSKSRQTSRQLPARNIRPLTDAVALDIADSTSDINDPALDTQIAHEDSGHESDISVTKQGRAKRGNKKVPAAAHKAKVGKNDGAMSRSSEKMMQTSALEIPPETNDEPDAMAIDERSINAEQAVGDIEALEKQPKVVKGSAKTSKSKNPGPKPRTTTRRASVASTLDEQIDVKELQIGIPSPPFPSVHSTPKPALSPQSSDAENQPPSSRPSTQRPPLLLQSPSKSQSTQVPLAPTTPTASPSRGSCSRLQTTHPWTMVDLEQIFQGTPAPDKENNPFVFGNPELGAHNALTSPEKKLSVEQWIHSNAQAGEEKLRNECERMVGKFESEGMRALKALEGIVCAE